MLEGAVFAGYAIERQLGRGGMGAVYLAKHPRLPRFTALKLLNEELFSDNELRARFEREADLVAQLEHPNIVTVFDRGADDGRLWISMQYIDGIDAATVQPRELAPARAIQIVAETAKALDFAHSRGVLHRDVKPANILLAAAADGRERVYLTDFGIARLVDEVGSRLTQTGSFTATLAYASPEQLTDATMDGRSDQYSLACTLYWLLSGAAPFESTNPAMVIQGHLQQHPARVTATRAGLPAALDAVLARAMSKHPADRFASCTEFAAAAHHALAGSALPVAHPGAGIRPATPAEPFAPQWPTPQPIRPRTPMPRPGFGHVPAPRRRSNAGAVAAVCVAVVVAVVAGIGVWATVDRSQAPPQRHLEEMRQAFPRLLPTAEVPAGQEYARGQGFGEIYCSGDVGDPRAFWMPGEQHPEFGTPTALWECSYANSYMIPASNTLWPYLKIFRYESSAEVKKVTDGLVGALTEQEAKDGQTYTNYKWGSEPKSSPRMLTVFPGDPHRERYIMYSHGQKANNGVSMPQLMDWWKSLPLT
ncbi:serine/threonine-protein kinase [Nocardia sp. NPDC058705]|uniref:serine/threonine-protein kinase n=1 Tax=Nocardia sp. NPDC058705 TaxID=3346609 RepID=UPI003675C111